MIELNLEEIPSFLRKKADKEASLGRTFRAEEFCQKAEQVENWLLNPDNSKFPIDNTGYYGFKITQPDEGEIRPDGDDQLPGDDSLLLLDEDDDKTFIPELNEFEQLSDQEKLQENKPREDNTEFVTFESNEKAEEIQKSIQSEVVDRDKEADRQEKSEESVGFESIDALEEAQSLEKPESSDSDDEFNQLEDDYLTFESDIQYVSDLLENGKFRETIVEADELLANSEKLSRDQVLRLEDLRFSANEKQTSFVSSLLEKAKNEINLAHYSEAEDIYNQVLEIDHDNEEATNYLRLIASKQAELREDAINQERIEKLIVDLSKTNNLRELEAAIRRAENFPEKSDALERVYVAARKFFDDARVKQNELTTIMRLGQVEGCYNALQEFLNLQEQGQEVVLVEGQTYRDINQVINEAEGYWREASKETTQTGIQETDNFLQALQYYVARERLNQLMRLPLVDEDKQEIEAKYAEVESALSNISDIRVVLEKADNAQNSLEALKIILTIDSEYRDLPEIISYREAYIEGAAKWLITQVNSELGEADRAEKSYHFKKALDHIAHASEKLLNLWPAVVEKPAILHETEEKIRIINSDIIEHELLYTEFMNRCEQIREMVSDPNQRRAGQKHLEQFKTDPKFKDYPLIGDFLFEMVGYQEVSDQVAVALEAHRNNQWQDAFDVSQKLLKSGEIGEFIDQIKQVNGESRSELEIIKLRSLINENNLRSAHELMDRLVTRDPNLKIRLENEANILTRALTVSPKFALLMDQAKQLETTDLPENLLQALRIFRYVSNMGNVEPNSQWPKFELNFEIVEARNAYRKLKDKMQATYVNDLVEAFQNRDNIPPDELHLLAEKAAVVRQGELLNSSDQRRAVSWFEIQDGLVLGESLYVRKNLEQAILTLQNLHKIYPNDNSVQDKLRKYIKEKALLDVTQYMLVKKDPTKAIAIIDQASSAGFGLSSDWEIALAYIEPYLQLNQFDKANNELKRAEKLGCPNDLIVEITKKIELEQKTYMFISEIEKNVEQKEYYDALFKINQKLDGTFENKKKIKTLKTQVFQTALDEIIDEIKHLRNSEDESDHIKALLHALDLRSLEDLMGTEEDLRQSTKLIQPGLEAKDQTIKYLLAEANRYAYSDYDLNTAIDKGRQILERLTSFLKFLENMDEKPDVLEQFKNNSEKFQDLIKDLNQIREILHQAEDLDLWVSAIKKEDFGQIELFTNRLEKTGYGLREIDNLVVRKDEWQENSQIVINQITKIKTLFEEGEFKETLSAINETEQRSLQRPSTGLGWKQLSDEDHAVILDLLNNRLKVVNIYTEDTSNIDLIGWKAIKEASLGCFREVGYWQEVFDDVKTDLFHVDAKLTEVTSLEHSGTLEQQLNGWTEASEVIMTLILGITNRSEHSAQSRVAKDLKEKLLHTKIELQDKYDLSNNKISHLSGEIDQLWPSQNEIKLAMESRNLDRLSILIKNMETVGPKDDLQRSILKTTKSTYERLVQENEKKKSFLGRFF